MLGLVAEGFDSCPMEGFDEKKVKKILNLNRNCHIVMILGIGKAAKDGVYGERYRIEKNLVIKSIIYLLEFNLASNLKSSRYNQINVTNKPKAAYHSMYFGAPFSAPSSIKSKSITRFNDATATTIKRETDTHHRRI